jgi:uncharacterized membrane protein YphA (DoxX/SURF4 family)
MFICTLSATTAAVGRQALGIIFSTAGLSKSLSPTQSSSVGSALRALGLTPLFLRPLVVGEILLGVWLISGTHPQASAWIAASTLLGFLVRSLFSPDAGIPETADASWGLEIG